MADISALGLLFAPFWSNFSYTTILGVLLILIGAFNNIVLALIGKLMSLLTGGRLTGMTLRILLIVTGVVMVWFVSTIKELAKSTEGVLILTAVVTFIIVSLIIFYRFSKDEDKKGGNSNNTIKF
jgi:hypothetical protein